MSKALGQDLPKTQSRPTLGPEPVEGVPDLVVRRVRKRWGKAVILDAVDLSLPPATTVWISGGNGAGKTTLLRIIAGIIAADEGTVSLGGVSTESDRATYQSQVGFLPAGNSGLYARLSVLQNLEFWSRLAFLGGAECRDAVARVIERFRLGELACRRADRLSLGQRQRVRLAMTFLHDPRLVLLDEPSANLDDEGVDTLLAAVDAHTRRGGMSIWCAPTRQAMLRCDKAYLLRDGHLKPD